MSQNCRGVNVDNSEYWDLAKDSSVTSISTSLDTDGIVVKDISSGTQTNDVKITLDGETVTVSNQITGFATEIKQLADNHNVTVSNPITGFATEIKQLADNHNVTVSNQITGYATEAKQLADNHNVTVSNQITGFATSDNQTNSNQKTQIVGAKWTSGVSGIDKATDTVQTIDYEHHEIHAGSHYMVVDVADLAINNVFDMHFVTPDTTKWTHWVFKLDTESETEWYVYEGAVITAALSGAVTPYNNDRNSANTSGNTLTSELFATIAAANVKTDISGATLLAHGIIGDGKNGGIDVRGRELILKQNTVYLLRAVANTAGYIDFDMEWYEHTNKN